MLLETLLNEVIPNRLYADGVITLVTSVYESCRQLGVDFKDVGLYDWLMFQQSEKEFPSKSITLKSSSEVSVTVFDYNKRSGRVWLKIKTSKKYKELLETVLKEKQSYNSRVYIKTWNTRGGEVYVSGEVQISIPLSFYYKHARKYEENEGKLIGGVDVNTDRLNLAIVDSDGNLRDKKVFWTNEVVRKDTSRHKARGIVGQAVHKLLDYAYYHGVDIVVFENLLVVKKRRYTRGRTANRKIVRFAERVTPVWNSHGYEIRFQSATRRP